MAQTANMVGLVRTRYLGTIAISVQDLSDLQLHMLTDLENTFFNINDFAEKIPIQYTHARSGNTESYKGIYDNPSQDIRAGSQTEIINAKPQVQFANYQMKQFPTMDDTLKVRGIRYNIDSYEIDGVGVVTIYLVRESQGIN